MKKVYKSFALLCVGLAAVACMDEPFEDVVLDTTPGNDIVFTAVAANDDLTTKTVYGAPGDDIVPLLWKHGDNIQIASPEAIGENNAEYTIGTEGEKDLQEAYSVTKSGDGGLQWSEKDTYNFYAMYPSPATLPNTGVYLDHDKKEMMGLIPMNQQPSNTPVLTNGGYTLEPDMRYAYMVAKDTYTRDASGDNVKLAFTPMVTTLQFDITANTIGAQTNDGGHQRLFLTGVSLLSKDKMDETGSIVVAPGKSISGNFTYNFESEEIKIEGNNRINMNFAGTGYELTKNQYCNVTFFLLPQNYPAGTLELQLFFTVGGTTQIRKTTIAIDIQKQKKYVFNDLLMPEIETNVTGSSWVSGLDPQMKVSQLSLPIAGNTFASTTYGDNSVGQYTQQQSLAYDKLWELGVRGFEFVNRSTRASSTDVPDYGLRDEKPVCYETVLSGDGVPTFGQAFETLVSFFVQPQYSREFLLLICTYQAIVDGYNPDRYVMDLLTYFDHFIAESETSVGKKFSMDNFVKLTSQTTIEQLQGNIAIIIRPGDDDRYESGAGNSDKLTSSISLKSKKGTDWSENVSLIADWGTAFDVWDRRYEEKVGDERKEVARESTFETAYYHKKGRPIVEHWLYGQSATGSTTYSALSGSDSYGYDAPALHKRYNNFNNFNNYEEDPEGNNGIKTELVLREGGFKYEHSIVGGGTAYVQEWSRVIPATLNNVVIDTELEGDRARLFVKWPESITEKKKAIDGLFMKSVSRSQNVITNDIYINSLSGYYATKNHMLSLLPFQQWFGGLVERSWFGRYTSMVTDQGKGGDSIGLADELNTYVYDVLSGRTEMSVGGKLAKGPWGLIVMDHIQPTGVSADLVKLIMMNNFEVESGGSGSDGNNEDAPEDEPTTPSPAWAGDYDSAYQDGQNAISFE